MSDVFRIGQELGDYEVLGFLGRGGMGEVYKVRNRISNRIEAMKVLLDGSSTEPEDDDRFRREIRICASLEHPNIARLYTATIVQDRLAMLMDWIDGMSVEQALTASKQSHSRAVEYCIQALAGLSYAHAKGVVHRDIKPSNLMLTNEEQIKVMDFVLPSAIPPRS